MISSNSILPHQSEDLFLTDGGLETTLVFHDGFELPNFAAFHLLYNEKGYQAIRDYYLRYLNIAKEFKTSFILESPTWRANPDWIIKSGYSGTALSEINAKAVDMMVDLKKEFEDQISNIIISGCIGPRGDGYKIENKMTIDDARDYHSQQISIFSKTPVNQISAVTINYSEEAIGIVRAANDVNLPVVISFTVETDGKLPSGMPLKEAIEQVDKSVSKAPAYYMINCAHPTHFFQNLQEGVNELWTKRIKGIRANASHKSHVELDEALELDSGNPEELGAENQKIKSLFDHINVFGGCCGTDERHVREIVKQLKKKSLNI